MRTNTYKVQPGTFHESDTEDLQVLVLRVSGKLNIRAQETSSIYSVLVLSKSRSFHRVFDVIGSRARFYTWFRCRFPFESSCLEGASYFRLIILVRLMAG